MSLLLIFCLGSILILMNCLWWLDYFGIDESIVAMSSI